MNDKDLGDIISWSLGKKINHGSRNISLVLGLLSGFF